jgi:response regulator RpfG family c-di-GMP phosphodiesterase
MSKLSTLPPTVASVLVVDDEPDILESIKELLAAEIPNVRVHGALNGPDAVRILGSEPVDAILCDYRMPGMDGLQVLVEARRVAPETARILITAYPELQLAVRAINEAQIQNFLTKPVQPNQLLEVMNAAILKARASRARASEAGPMARRTP